MVNKINCFILILIYWLFSSIVQAEISLSIDRNQVRVNETFELTLHMETSPVSRPPLTGLPIELEVVRSSNFYQRSTVNGHSEVQAGWRFTLKATREGIFTIPEIEIDGKKTQPLQLKVLPAVNSTAIGGQQDAILLKATVDSNEVYEQQQIILTIRLYRARAVQAQYASLTEPEMPEALLERLGEDRQFETEIEGMQYIVLERRYAIYPQQHGKQIISPIIFTAEVSDGSKRRSIFGRFQSRTKAVSLSTDGIHINVIEKPQTADSWWLPAANITLTEQWQPESAAFRVGEPVTWSYTINAKGLTATQLPELHPEKVSGLKFYPDTPQSANQSTQEGITGSRTQKIAVIPAYAGPITIPELKLSWWDVEQDKAREIKLASRTIEVLPSLDGNYGTIPVTKKPIVQSKGEVIKSENNLTDINNTKQTTKQLSNPDVLVWKMIAFISLLLWIILALFLFLKKTMFANLADTRQQEPVPSVVTMAEIQRACKNNSAIKTRKALLDWCRTQKEYEAIHSLTDLANSANNELSEQLKLLERHLYAAGQNDWDGKTMYPLLKELKRSSNKQTKMHKEQLPPLHPEKD